MLCMPFTTTVATVCSEMMMISEMKTNDTMKKTEDTMEDVKECVPLAFAARMRQIARASTPPRESQDAEQKAFKNRVRLRPQMAAEDARLHGH